jgi:hypothetical protein
MTRIAERPVLEAGRKVVMAAVIRAIWMLKRTSSASSPGRESARTPKIAWRHREGTSGWCECYQVFARLTNRCVCKNKNSESDQTISKESCDRHSD